MEKKFYAPKELLEILGISKAHMYNMIKSGTIPSISLGNRFLIPATWVNDLGVEKGGGPIKGEGGA